ncbi:MAG: hypothetical protein ACSLE3_13450 [Microbacteriaceae bacterium]
MNIKRKIAALAVAGAMVVGGVGVAQSAQAAEIPGVITITPTSGNVNTDVNFLYSIGVSVGAPAGYRAISGTFVFQGGVNMGAVSIVRDPSVATTFGTFGLDGNPSYADRFISPTNDYVTDKLLSQTDVPLATGAFELRNYYFASSTAPDFNDPYTKLDMTYNATSGAWAVYTAPSAPIATTVSLTAGETATPGEVSLGATVKKASDGTVATAAAGNVVFKEGAATVATVPVALGLASALLTSVADGTHIYTAEFVSSNTVYSGSASLTATVVVGAVTAPGSKTSNITVTIPSGVGTLTLSGVSSSVALGTASLSGGTLNASGTLNSRVTDSRQLEYPAWSLTGQVGDFTSAVGGHVLNGKYLGWTPSISGDAVGSAAGAVVLPAPGTVNGLKTSSVLATGLPNETGTITNASALLQLKAPSNTRAGAYSATLTLTLV